MKADTIITNIGQLINPPKGNGPLKGKAMDTIESFNHAFVAIKDGVFLDYGTHDYQAYVGDDTTIIDVQGRLVTPGLIDSHTHVVHAGSREFEFEKKMRGVPYIEILKAGGGIHSTVKATQEATEEALYKQSKKSLNHMLKLGVTTVEGKSGYGLELDTEMKQLRVQKRLNADHPIDIVPTFMGAHAMPKVYENDRMTFLNKVIAMMPEVKKEDLATFVDVFCEDGAFNLEESRMILEAAKQHGFKLKIHADEIVPLGGVPLAVALGATSADHLMAIDEAGLKALSNSDCIANILPSTSFNLGSDYAPVRTMLDRNIAVAVSSDYNPGSSPSENFLFTLNIAAIHLKMSPNEILNAATINAAYAVDRADEIGRIEKGKKADLTVFDAQNWPYVLYHFAINHVSDVFKDGKHVVKNKNLIWE